MYLFIYNSLMDSQAPSEVFLTAKQLEHKLGITPMTLINWRKAENPNLEPIPHIVTGEKRGLGYQLRFPMTKVRQWLLKFKPTYAHRLSNICSCVHCQRMEEVAEIVEKAAEELQQSA